MGWTTPTDRSSGYTVTAADWNIVEDDLTFLFGDTGWTNATLGNSWTNTTGNARFALVGRLVVISGLVGGGALNTTMFTLPAGYRPTAATFRAAVSANAAFGVLTVSSAGAVQLAVGATTNVSLDCCFPTI